VPFRNPWALAGLAAMLLPLLVHLLSRAPASRRAFPTLRFVEATRLPPRRFTRVHDPLLMAVRMLVVGAAAVALAHPVLPVGDRRAEMQLVRAVVLDTSASVRGTGLDSARRTADALAAAAATSLVIPTADPGAAVAGAAEWLAGRHGMHELVVVSDFQRGALDGAGLAAVPARYGVRLVRTPTAATARAFTLPATRGAVDVAVDGERVLARWRNDTVVARRYGVRVEVASPGLRALARATLPAADALFADALFASDSARPVVRIDTGAVPVVAGVDSVPAWAAALLLALARDPLLAEAARMDAGDRAARGALTLVHDAAGRVRIAASSRGARELAIAIGVDRADAPLAAALLVAVERAARADAGDPREHEPLTIADDSLRAWSRAPADTVLAMAGGMRTAPDAPTDGGASDARWFWALALLLLGVEWLLRRGREGAS
jgi:hypothetical protein